MYQAKRVKVKLEMEIELNGGRRAKLNPKKSEEEEKGRNLFVLTESDPDMDFVHGLPENESSQRHCKVRRHFHHPKSLFSASFDASIQFQNQSPLSFSFCV